MLRFRKILRFDSLAALAALLFTSAPSGAQVVVAKQHYYFQTGATTAQEDFENGPWMYLTQVQGADGALTYTDAAPGAAAVAMQNFGGGNNIAYTQTLFSTQAALDAQYPDGGYTLAVGSAPIVVPVIGAFPDVGTVSAVTVTPVAKAPDIAFAAANGTGGGANWTNGVLVWDTSQDLKLTATFPGTFTPGSSFLQITVFGIPLTFASSPPFSGGIPLIATNAPDFTSNQVTVTLPGNGTSAYPFLALEAVLVAENLSSSGSTSLGNPTLGGHATVTSFFINSNPVYQGRPVRITTQPQSVAAGVGQTVNFTVAADGDPAPSIQWFHVSTPIAGAHGTTLSYTIQPTDDLTYVYASVSNKLDTVRSALARISAFNGPPVLANQPISQMVTAGQTVTFISVANGSGAGYSYQWYFNGSPIAGGANGILTVANVQAANVGSYYVVVTTPGGSTTSSTGTIKLLTGSSGLAPSFGPPPGSVLAAPGMTVVFNGTVQNPKSATYQWFFNNAPIAGATSPNLLLPAVTNDKAGSYTCTATNAAGSTTSPAATLNLTSTGPQATHPGHLINLSVLSSAAGSGPPFTIGYVVGGPGTQGKENLLIRATGPTLASAPFNLLGTLDDPTITLHGTVDGQDAILATNDNWGTPASNQVLVAAADNAVSAFTLPDSSLDSALTQTLDAGLYSVQITGKNGSSGTTLGEVYDTTPTSAYTVVSRRLINVSCRNTLPAQGLLTAGFVVGGSSQRTVLIRGIGPALANSFGIAGAMSDPQLALFGSPNGGTPQQMASNAGWNGDPSLTAACNAVNAFPLTDTTSHDAMLLTMLMPGSYSVQLSSSSGAAGAALIEVYEVP